MQHTELFLYSDYGLLSSTWLEYLQGAFDALKEIFNWFGLQKKIGNMVEMVFQPCYTVGNHSEEAYA